MPAEMLHKGQKLSWNFKVELKGARVVDAMIHICEVCDHPIILYGRMIPCKHVFCHACAEKASKEEKKCSRCHDPVQRVEKCGMGSVFVCTFGAPRHSSKGCRRSYLSQRDLQAHMTHRHKVGVPTSKPPSVAVPSTVAPHEPIPPVPQSEHQPPPMVLSGVMPSPSPPLMAAHPPVPHTQPGFLQQVSQLPPPITIPPPIPTPPQPSAFSYTAYGTPRSSAPLPPHVFMTPQTAQHLNQQRNSNLISVPIEGADDGWMKQPSHARRY